MEKSIDELINKKIDQLKDLLVKKNKSYGGASFDLGMTGNFVHLWDKVMRLKQLVWKKQTEIITDESIEDTLLDTAGYCIIGLIILDKKAKEDLDKKAKEEIGENDV